MPTAITATSGSASANSFCSQAEAVTLMGDRLNSSTFTGAASDDQITALLEAAKELTRLAFIGKRTNSTQALSWPRNYAENPDLPESEDGLSSITYFGNTVIPQRIKNAQAELALEFLRAGTIDIAGRDSEREVLRKKVDVLETEFASPNSRPSGLVRFPVVMRELTPLLSGANSGLEVMRV